LGQTVGDGLVKQDGDIKTAKANAKSKPVDYLEPILEAEKARSKKKAKKPLSSGSRNIVTDADV
jgi:hypothetical protein